MLLNINGGAKNEYERVQNRLVKYLGKNSRSDAGFPPELTQVAALLPAALARVCG